MDNYFEHAGTKLRYQILGQDQPLVFLHGIGTSTLSIDRLLTMLAKHYQVIAPDLPYFGKSSTPKEVWDYENYADFIADFIDSLNLKSFNLVGHSFGGEIALRLTKKNLQIENLIIIGATGKPIRHPLLKLIYIAVWGKKPNELENIQRRQTNDVNEKRPHKQHLQKIYQSY